MDYYSRTFTVSLLGFLLIVLGLGCQQVKAQFTLSELSDWENPQTIGINKESPRSIFVSYPDMESAVNDTDLEVTSPFYKSLDGEWKFKWSPNPKSRPATFYKNNSEVNNWDDIQVPAPWQTQGYGQPIYLNEQYPMESIMGGLFPPRVPRDNNPVGSYKRTFTVPGGWEDRQTFVHFGGVKSAFYLWVNGKKVGYSEGAMTPAEFNITPYLQEGENTLSVEVYRWSDGSWLEDQDMWRLSGIYRSVYLHSQPKVHFQDFEIQGGLDEQYQDGKLEITAEVRHNTDKFIDAPIVEAHLFDQQGNRVGDGPVATAETEYNLESGMHSLAELRTEIKNPQKWTAETPNLYTVVLVLKNSDERVLEITRETTGFREAEIRDNMFMVNGKEVKLKGANLHDHDPQTGRTVDYETMVKDVKLMKRNNLNAVRMSHYPHDAKYYELFDQYGLYVMDEANIETHGISFRKNLLPGSDPLWTDAVMDRTRSMVEARKNHPSVVMWSLGNEAGYGTNFEQMAAYIRKADPTRPIHYQHMNSVADMMSYMYPSLDYLQDVINDPEITKPILLCEFVHSMGNSTGNLDEYMSLMENNHNFIGAFIWDWVDQGLWKETENGEGYWAYGGDYGDEPNDGNFNFNGVVFPDRQPKPALEKVKHSYQSIKVESEDLKEGNIRVTNNFSHSSLEDYQLRWSMTEDGKSIQSGSVDALNIKAGDSQEINLPTDTPKLQAGREYWLNISFHLKEDTRWANKGFKVAWQQMKIPYAVDSAPQISTDKITSLQVEEGDDKIKISDSNFSVVISQSTGALERYQFENESYISGSLKPNFWRATTDNDRAGWGGSLDPWKEAAQNRTVKSIDVSKVSGNRVQVLVKGTLPVGQSTYQTKYTVLGDGMVQVDQKVTPIGNEIPPALPRVGMQMQIPKQYQTMTWYGRGPEENYWDRKKGISVGNYAGQIDSLWTNYPYPQENGNRSDVRWVAFTDDQGNGLMAVAESMLNISAWPYTLWDLEEASHINELPRRDFYTANIDYKQQGVGGINSWTSHARALPEYRISTSESYRYRYYLHPITSEMDKLRNVGNRAFPQKSQK
ncbi:hypothetical protein CK503_05475 [Aliifodinibius salipaludis]|uniref:beta-galactosidase n=1 Tax=Fodinibius salipaludis TaxID=2032627 RepID=A0A2A2GCK8_9BACT|nr:glycoside hydrolase family 2 TIM barrel-domain containing protein [Aliifodinibius salipaludis]PAU94920.1 hypothetical protein CK503_05475 [Aliifodinibius salipaludis]